MSEIIKIFKSLEDYREQGKIKHKLIDIIVITVCAVFCGAENYAEIYNFGKIKEQWFKKLLKLENGIPSQDTFERIFRYTNSDEFKKCFLELIRSYAKLEKGELIAIDGKAVRAANNFKENPIYIVNAWAKEAEITLALEKVEEKSNEITALPKVLDMIEVKNNIITMDAMGCLPNVAKIIKDKEGDYVITTKANKHQFYKDIKDYFKYHKEYSFKELEHDYYETIEKSHGRIERRKYYITEDIEWLNKKEKYPGLKSIGMVESVIERNGKITTDTRFHIVSLKADAKKYAECVRGHWSIENNLHWQLDVTMNEDKSRARVDNAVENLAVIRRIVLNLLKQDTTIKAGMKTKQKALSWNTDYALTLLFSNLHPID